MLYSQFKINLVPYEFNNENDEVSHIYAKYFTLEFLDINVDSKNLLSGLKFCHEWHPNHKDFFFIDKDITSEQMSEIIIFLVTKGKE